MSIKDEIIERIGVHKLALVVLEKFNWIEREQPISDYGIDLHIEIVDDDKPTGLLYAVQTKSGTSYFKETSESSITYRGNIRHLEYWEGHSLPVLLVLYNPESDTMFWCLVKEEKATRTEKSWKIEVPKTNVLTNKSKEEIKSYYINTNLFKLLETEDTSHALSRRISVKLLHKKDLSKIVIKKTLPQIVKKLKSSDYFRNEIVQKYHKDNLADSIWVYTYKTLDQFNHGFAYCIAVWNKPGSSNPTNLGDYDEIIDDKIGVKWGNNLVPDELIEDKEMSKGKYLKIIDDYTIKVQDTINIIKDVFNKTKEIGCQIAKSNILEVEPSFKNALPEEFEEYFPPYECEDLDQEIQNITCSIGNIFIVSKDPNRGDDNFLHCVEMYLKTSSENLKAINYERKKCV